MLRKGHHALYFFPTIYSRAIFDNNLSSVLLLEKPVWNPVLFNCHTHCHSYQKGYRKKFWNCVSLLFPEASLVGLGFRLLNFVITIHSIPAEYEMYLYFFPTIYSSAIFDNNLKRLCDTIRKICQKPLFIVILIAILIKTDIGKKFGIVFHCCSEKQA